MTEDELRAFIERQEARAQRTDVAEEQAMAMDYYLRRPFGNEEEGRSKVISSDVWDVVEGMMPALLKPFVSSSDVVQFNPHGPEDEEAAKQETDYLNYVVTQRNDSFTQLSAWGKAGLLQKNGIVKYWWDTTRRVTIETLRDVDEDTLAALSQDDEISLIALTENEPVPPGIDEMGQPVPAPRSFDVKIRRTDKDGFARYETVPPEEFLIIGRDPNPQNATFVQHRQRMTISDLREMGYDVPDDIQDTGAGNASTEMQASARQRGREFDTIDAADGSGDKSMREVWYRESIARVDFDGDGVAELRKVCMVGTTVLANEEVEEINFCAWTPYQQLWQFDGRCPADEAIEVQEVKSTLVRENMNNLYTINNNRTYAGNKVNLDDLIDNQIGGVVRIDSDVVGNQIATAPIAPIGAIIQPALEYWDSVKENRTGFTRYNQGAADLNNQKTLGEVRIVAQAGNGRMELIQRSLAEQGLKPLMLGMHNLTRRHATKAETVRLRGKWVTIDPRSWKRRMDMTVSVGLGTMDKSMELQGQGTLVAMQKDGATAGVVSPENVYNGMAKYAELLGEKNPDKYFTHPEKMPKPQPPDPMQNPEFMLKVKESKQKDRELDQREYELRQGDRKIGQDDERIAIDKFKAKADTLIDHQKLEMDVLSHKRDMAAPHPQELAAASQAQQMSEQQESTEGADDGQD